MKLYRIKEFTHKHIWVSSASMARCVNQSKTNGLVEYGGIVRDGKKVFIDEDKFIKWVLDCSTNLKRMYEHNILRNSQERCKNG